MDLAIIPARGGSKRIPHKNGRMVAGRPLLAWTLDAVDAAGVFDEVHVSTDERDLADIAADAGHPVGFLRDPALADDHTPLRPVLRWVVDRYEDAGRRVDVVALVAATAMLLEPGDLSGAMDRFDAVGRAAPVMAVTRYPAPIEWAFRIDADWRLKALDLPSHARRSQDLEGHVYDAGAFLIMTVEQLRAETPPGYGVLLPTARAVDVDDEDDLELVELLLLGRQARAAQAP